MKAQVIKLAEFDELHQQMTHSIFSLKPFIEYLEQRVKEDHSVKNKFFGYVLEKIREATRNEPDFDLENVSRYADIFELVYVCLTQLIDDEQNKLWGLSLPMTPVLLYCTDGMYNIMMDETNEQKVKILEKNSMEEVHVKYEMIYSFILKNFYGCHHEIVNEFIHSVIDEKTLLPKYFKIDFDKRFIKVYANQELPKLEKVRTFDYLRDKASLDELRQKLPLSLFRFEGMTVLSLTDVTPQYAIENIKDIIINKTAHTSTEHYGSIIQSLKALIGNNKVEFGMLPFLRLNDRLVFDEESCPRSKLVETSKKHGVLEQMYMSVAEHYYQNPKLLYYETITKEDEDRQIFLKALKQAGVVSYALIPVFYNNKLAGVLEMVAQEEGVFHPAILNKLEPAIPFLAQLLQDNVDEFSALIENVIKDKFTSLQPAVQWKFKEAGFQYVQQRYKQKTKPEVEQIIFSDIFPLYGAIDIRNSTLERNLAIRDDIQYQLGSLLTTFEEIKSEYPFGLTDEMMYKIRKWKTNLEDAPTPSDEYRLNDFLDSEVKPFLDHIKRIQPSTSSLIEKYHSSLDKVNGEAHRNRRNLEDSMQLINKSISAYLDKMNTELQKSYPFYFEKFRTDGIEYDIYIGQSISPNKPFDAIYLKNLRLWQLQSMASIYKLVLSLQPQMKKELHITELIFINANTIDISFRTDEKKFDVEGAYNIRYQLVKKRIDKVHVKETGERLTQPGKIALIYFNNKEAREYKDYIQYLQEQHVFTNDLEELELEELQGVSGLKALRVTINVD